MTRKVHENNIVAKWLNSIASADLSAVTQAEWDAGTTLTELTSDGLGINPTNNNASIPMMDEGKIGQKPGTRSMAIDLRHARHPQAGADPMWDLFEYGLEGALVVSRDGAPAVGDPLEVYQGTTHDPTPIASAQDTYQQFTVDLVCDNWNSKSALTA